MTRRRSLLLAAITWLYAASCSTDPGPPEPVSDLNASARDAPSIIPSSSRLEGFWFGSWGGGAGDAIVMQPVVAELLIDGDHVEMAGFPGVSRLRGTLRNDADARRISILPAVEAGGPSQPRAVEFVYQLQADSLTLTGSDGNSIALQRRRTARHALANIQLEFVAASGINRAGDLLVTEFSVLQAGQGGAPWYEPRERTLNAQRATILLVQDSALKEISIDEARDLLPDLQPVVIAFRKGDSPPVERQFQLLSSAGPVEPDDHAARQVLSHVLRPGTLVFILSPDDNVPLP